MPQVRLFKRGRATRGLLPPCAKLNVSTAAMHSSLPVRVISAVSSVRSACPLLLRLLPNCCATANVETGHKETHASEQKALSLDHLLSDGQQFIRYGEAKRLGGLEIDYKLEFGRLLHRQVGGFVSP